MFLTSNSSKTTRIQRAAMGTAFVLTGAVCEAQNAPRAESERQELIRLEQEIRELEAENRALQEALEEYSLARPQDTAARPVTEPQAQAAAGEGPMPTESASPPPPKPTVPNGTWTSAAAAGGLKWDRFSATLSVQNGRATYKSTMTFQDTSTGSWQRLEHTMAGNVEGKEVQLSGTEKVEGFDDLEEKYRPGSGKYSSVDEKKLAFEYTPDTNTMAYTSGFSGHMPGPMTPSSQSGGGPGNDSRGDADLAASGFAGAWENRQQAGNQSQTVVMFLNRDGNGEIIIQNVGAGAAVTVHYPITCDIDASAETMTLTYQPGAYAKGTNVQPQPQVGRPNRAAYRWINADKSRFETNGVAYTKLSDSQAGRRAAEMEAKQFSMQGDAPAEKNFTNRNDPAGRIIAD